MNTNLDQDAVLQKLDAALAQSQDPQTTSQLLKQAIEASTYHDHQRLRGYMQRFWRLAWTQPDPRQRFLALSFRLYLYTVPERYDRVRGLRRLYAKYARQEQSLDPIGFHHSLSKLFLNIGLYLGGDGECARLSLEHCFKTLFLFEKEPRYNLLFAQIKRSHIGSAYFCLGDFSTAYHYWDSVRGVLERIAPQSSELYSIYTQLARWHATMGNYEQGLAFARKAHLPHNRRMSYGLARCWEGLCLVRLGRAHEGVAVLREALEIGQGFRHRFMVMTCYQALSEAYHQLKRYRAGWAMYRRYHRCYEQSIRHRLEAARFVEGLRRQHPIQGQVPALPSHPLPSTLPSDPADRAFLTELNSLVLANFSDTHFGVALLAEAMQTPLRTLRRKTLRLLGVGPHELILEVRIKAACRMLSERKQNRKSLTQIAQQSGFRALGYFNQVFKKRLGVLPSAYVSQVH